MKYELSNYAVIFKALSDETRLRILTMLINGKTCACKILEKFNFTQPTLSYHMKQLTGSGLINAEKNGKWVHYYINGETIKSVKKIIDEICGTDNLTDRFF